MKSILMTLALLVGFLSAGLEVQASVVRIGIDGDYTESELLRLEKLIVENLAGTSSIRLLKLSRRDLDISSLDVVLADSDKLYEMVQNNLVLYPTELTKAVNPKDVEYLGRQGLSPVICLHTTVISEMELPLNYDYLGWQQVSLSQKIFERTKPWQIPELRHHFSGTSEKEKAEILRNDASPCALVSFGELPIAQAFVSEAVDILPRRSSLRLIGSKDRILMPLLVRKPHIESAAKRLIVQWASSPGLWSFNGRFEDVTRSPIYDKMLRESAGLYRCNILPYPILFTADGQMQVHVPRSSIFNKYEVLKGQAKDISIRANGGLQLSYEVAEEVFRYDFEPGRDTVHLENFPIKISDGRIEARSDGYCKKL